MATKSGKSPNLHPEFADRLVEIMYLSAPRYSYDPYMASADKRKVAITRLKQVIKIDESMFNAWTRGEIAGDKRLTEVNLLKILLEYLGKKGLESVEEVEEFLSYGCESYLTILKQPGFLQKVQELQLPLKRPNQGAKSTTRMGVLPVCQDYIERSQEAEVVKRLVNPDGPKVLIVHGARGMGKTELMRRLSSVDSPLCEYFIDGIYWLDFASLTPESLRIILFRAGIEVDEKALAIMGEHAILDAWIEWVCNPERRVLFVFDDLDWEKTLPDSFVVTGEQVRFLAAAREKDCALAYLKKAAKDRIFSVALTGFGDEEIALVSEKLPENPEFGKPGDAQRVFEDICKRLWGYPELVLAARKIVYLPLTIPSADTYMTVMIQVDEWMNFSEIRTCLLRDLRDNACYMEYISERCLNDYPKFDDSLRHAEEITGLPDKELRILLSTMKELGLARRVGYHYEIHPVFRLGLQQERFRNDLPIVGPIR